MSSSANPSVIRRMVAPAKPASENPLAGADDAHIRVQFPRGGDELLGLSLEVTAVSTQTLSQQDVIAALGEHDLVYTLHRAGTGVGLVVVDSGLLAALIEVQTTGRVAATPTPERVPSLTDAVVASDIVDRWLGDVADEAGTGAHAGAAFRGAHRGDRHLDLRAVGLTLDPGRYDFLKVSMSLGDGARHGSLLLALPVSGAGGRVIGSGPVDIRSVMNPVPADLMVDMARFPVRLTTLTGLAEGAVIPIPPMPLGRATLRAIDGRDVAVVALGQSEGRWAIRKLGSSDDTERGDTVDFGEMSLGDDVEPPPALADISEDGVLEGQMADLSGGLPPLPDLPAPSEGTDLPDLPELPELPDLPDLPELPDLPDLP